MAQRPLNNWSDVVTAVSNAGSENKNKHVIQNLRKLHYRNVLMNQIEQHNKQMNTQKSFKQRQLSQIVLDSQQEKKNLIDKKLSKMRTEQWYQLENLDLIKLHNNSNTQKNNAKEGEGNQFFRLQDNQKQRKIETRKNFQLQNLLNNKQLQIKNKQKSKQKQRKFYQKEMYNSYIEGQFQKKQSDRQLWRNKYLYDKSIRELGGYKDYGYAYQSFLRKQMDQKRRNKNQTQKLDGKLKNFNQTAENPNSSPAYFGVSESFDRKKQLSLLDRDLHFQPGITYKREMARKSSGDSSSNFSKVQKSLPEIKPLKQSLPTPKQYQISNRYYQTKQQVLQDKKLSKQYTSYDFISGTKKTFFM